MSLVDQGTPPRRGHDRPSLSRSRQVVYGGVARVEYATKTEGAVPFTIDRACASAARRSDIAFTGQPPPTDEEKPP